MFFNFILLPARQLRNALSKHELSNLSTCQDGSKSTGESSTTNRAGLAFLAMFESTQLYIFSLLLLSLSNNMLCVAKVLPSFSEKGTFLVSMGTPLKYDKLDWVLN